MSHPFDRKEDLRDPGLTFLPAFLHMKEDKSRRGGLGRGERGLPLIGFQYEIRGVFASLFPACCKSSCSLLDLLQYGRSLQDLDAFHGCSLGKSYLQCSKERSLH